MARETTKHKPKVLADFAKGAKPRDLHRQGKYRAISERQLYRWYAEYRATARSVA